MFFQVKGQFSVVSIFWSNLILCGAMSSMGTMGRALLRKVPGLVLPRHTRHPRGFSVHPAAGAPWEHSQFKHALVQLKEEKETRIWCSHFSVSLLHMMQWTKYSVLLQLHFKCI